MDKIIKFPYKNIDLKFEKKECFLEDEDPNNLLKEDTLVWQCKCSCHTFFILQDKIICSNCGTEAEGF